MVSDQKNLKVLKFMHKEIPNAAVIGDVAKAKGVTHLSLFSNQQSLAHNTAVLNLIEVGPPHFINNNNTNANDNVNDNGNNNNNSSNHLPADCWDEVPEFWNPDNPWL